MSELIDTHAHLDDEKFKDDLSAVLERAKTAGVSHVVTIGTTASSSAVCVTLGEMHPMLWVAVGIQPNHVAEESSTAWDEILNLVGREKVIALGETGLDRHWDYTPFHQQEDYFARHLELGRKRCLPVVIHCREAEADIVRMLRQEFNRFGPVSAVMHSYTGDQSVAQACLEMGLFISFAGMLTYKNAQALRDLAKTIPLDRLLVETDSPYLAPVPVRGKRNEPSFIVHTAAVLAETLGVSASTIAEHTSRNAIKLFALR